MIFYLSRIPHRAIVPEESFDPRRMPIEGDVLAQSWLDAKRCMGFPLSPLQQRILRGEASPFEISGAWVPGITSKARVVTPLPDPTQAFLSTVTSDRGVGEEQS